MIVPSMVHTKYLENFLFNIDTLLIHFKRNLYCKNYIELFKKNFCDLSLEIRFEEAMQTTEKIIIWTCAIINIISYLKNYILCGLDLLGNLFVRFFLKYIYCVRPYIHSL